MKTETRPNQLLVRSAREATAWFLIWAFAFAKLNPVSLTEPGLLLFTVLLGVPVAVIYAKRKLKYLRTQAASKPLSHAERRKEQIPLLAGTVIAVVVWLFLNRNDLYDNFVHLVFWLTLFRFLYFETMLRTLQRKHSSAK